MKPLKISRLYFQHIKGTELERRGVTAEDLAENLARHGFVEILQNGAYFELSLKERGKTKADYFRTVWSTQPKPKDLET